MGLPPQSGVQIDDFPGLFAGTDPLDLPAGGAEEQVNVTCLVLGELQVRAGYRVVTFENP
jgi:hypothetical protein